MTTKKLLPLCSALLCASILLITACSSEDTTVTDVTAANIASDTTTADETVITRENYPDDLPDTDWDGKTFRASVTDKYEYEIGVAEENGDVCNDSVYLRNRKVEEKYNVTVKTIPVEMEATDNMSIHSEILQKSILAGDDEFDIAMLYVFKAPDLVFGGCFTDIASLDYVNFDKPWWNERANEAFTVAGKLYTSVSDLSLTALQLSYCFLYNKSIAENYQIGDMYSIVNEGKWTIDKLQELSASIYSDINGNSEHDMEDLYGIICDQVTGLDAYREAFDIPNTGRDDEGYPTLTVNTPKMAEAIEKLYTLYYENEGSHVEYYWEKYDYFTNNQALFIPARVITLYDQLRGMEIDYGVIPYPKFNEEQEEYLTGLVDNYSLICVPTTAGDPDFSGFMIEALSAETYRSVVYQYYDVALQTKYTRDDQSIEMLDTIMAGRNYDIATMLASSMGGSRTIIRKMIVDKNNNFASFYAANESAYNAAMEKIVDALKALEN